MELETILTKVRGTLGGITGRKKRNHLQGYSLVSDRPIDEVIENLMSAYKYGIPRFSPQVAERWQGFDGRTQLVLDRFFNKSHVGLTFAVETPENTQKELAGAKINGPRAYFTTTPDDSQRDPRKDFF